MKIIPNLCFNGNCSEAITYYKDIFNGEILQTVSYEEVNIKCSEKENKYIFSSILMIGKDTIYLSDKIDEKIGNNITIMIEFFNEIEFEEIYSKLKEGNKIVSEIKETNWGSSYAEIVDKFGVTWGLNYEMQLI
ncbi:MAG: VOC family protein [Fusobacteriaceae bacterium]|nr:VOC family protein [Fusobacteriaceae bacterium]